MSTLCGAGNEIGAAIGAVLALGLTFFKVCILIHFDAPPTFLAVTSPRLPPTLLLTLPTGCALCSKRCSPVRFWPLKPILQEQLHIRIYGAYSDARPPQKAHRAQLLPPPPAAAGIARERCSTSWPTEARCPQFKK